MDHPLWRRGSFDVKAFFESLESVPQADAPPQQDRDHRDVHVVDESGGEELVDRRGASAEAYVLIARADAEAGRQDDARAAYARYLELAPRGWHQAEARAGGRRAR